MGLLLALWEIIGLSLMLEMATTLVRYELQVTDASLEAIAESLRHAEELRFTWCLQLSDHGVYNFAQYASRRSLRTLDLSACRRVGDDGVLGIAQLLTSLTSLNLYYCNKARCVMICNISYWTVH